MLPEKELREIENRLYRATPGPWVSSYSENGKISIYSESRERAYFYHGEWIADVSTEEDLKFLVNSVEDIQKLLKEVYRLKTILDKSMYKEIVETFCHKLNGKTDDKK